MDKYCTVCKALITRGSPDPAGRCNGCACSHAADLARMTYGKWMARYKQPPEPQDKKKK